MGTPDTLLDKTFKDKHGKVVLWQSPNVPLYGWVLFKVLSLLIHAEPWKNGVSFLSEAFLFTWAYMELKSGVNYFRRGLGLVVFIMIIVSHFH